MDVKHGTWMLSSDKRRMERRIEKEYPMGEIRLRTGMEWKIKYKFKNTKINA